MILATDLDRTLLPNGEDAYDGTLPLLFRLVREQNLTLVYVSGRNDELLREAVREHNIPLPDYFIAEVGTVIYRIEGEEFIKDASWKALISNLTPGWEREAIEKALGEAKNLPLQEGWKQNEFKISYYAQDLSEQNAIVTAFRETLERLSVPADVIWSVDPQQRVGLVDILPRAATKVTALEFVREKLGEKGEDVIYCGDSGNDVLPLTCVACGYRSIVVKNAPDDVKEEVLSLARQGGFEERVYIAKGKDKLNGNYSSGIIEGLQHFGIV